MEYIENYKNLANAIIIQACDDFIKSEINETQFRHFVYSDLFSVLTNVNPDVIYECIIKRKEEYVKKKKKYKANTRKINI